MVFICTVIRRLAAARQLALLGVCGIAFLVPIAEKNTRGHELKDILHRPAALACSADQLLVANRSGSLTVIDLERLAVTDDVPVGEQLSAVTLDSSGNQCIVADVAAHQLVVLNTQHQRWQVQQRIQVPMSPVSISLAENDGYCSVACQWARQLAIVETGSAANMSWTVRHIVDLPFAPRLQWIDESSHLVFVADAFGDRLAVIDPVQGRISGLFALPGRNIRGLQPSADGQSLLIALQLLNEQVPTERDRIVWGAVVSNLVIQVDLNELLTNPSDSADTVRPIAHWSVYPLGSSGNGSGDPADLKVDGFGRWVVALGGTDELVRFDGSRREKRCAVGRRPVAIVADTQRDRWYIANQLDDSITVINSQQFTAEIAISLNEHTTPSFVDEGERLFFNARLSLDGWYSCHSCHTDGHTSGARNDNLADGDYGAPKRIPSLLGASATAPFAWNASRSELTEQIDKSVHFTMQGGDQFPVGEHEIAAIEAYLATLDPAPGIDVARGRVSLESSSRGGQVFQARGCADCHAPPFYTTASTYDVGLADEHRRRQFNPPSLLGVSQRDRFLHDNRAATLRDVFEVHGHPAGTEWTAAELDDLLAFLRTL